jgi:hypothetical protein
VSSSRRNKQLLSCRRSSIALGLRATEITHTGNQTKTKFYIGIVTFVSADLLFETKDLDPGAILISCLVSELRRTSKGIELRTVFRAVKFVSVSLHFKLLPALFFYHAKFPSCSNRPHRKWTSKHFSKVCTLYVLFVVSRNMSA